MSFETTSKSASQVSLTTDPDRFSDDAWDLLLASQDVAKRWRHQNLDVEHLLQVLFSARHYRHWVDGLPLDKNRKLRL